MDDRIRVPHIETQRLLLRGFELTDAEDVFAYASDAETTRYVNFSPHRTIQDAYDAIQYIYHRPKEKGPESFAIVEKTTNKVIGTVGFWVSGDDDVYELGYILNRDYWNVGIMSESLRAVLKYAFNEYGVRRMEARHHVMNHGSKKVILKQGFIYEGTRRRVMKTDDYYADILYYSLLKEEFK